MFSMANFIDTLAMVHIDQCQEKTTCVSSRYAVDIKILPIMTGNPTLQQIHKKYRQMISQIVVLVIKSAYLKNCRKVNLYPCCSATPAQTTFAEAPIRVPLPTKK